MLIDFEELKHKLNDSTWYGTAAWYDILDIISDCEDKGRNESYRPVIECQACRHWNSETLGCKRNPCVEAWRESDYCSYGDARGE